MSGPITSRSGPTTLTVLYDETCALCLRCRDWLLAEPCLVRVELLPAGSAEARSRYPQATPWLGAELVVVDEARRAWVGPAAFVTCLWATARFRAWSFRLSSPTLAPLAEACFRWVSRRRGMVPHRSHHAPGCAECEQRELWRE